MHRPRRARAPAAPGPTPGSVDGLNPDDPGMLLLDRALRDVEPATIALVCCGDLPSVGPAATRLILDERERAGARTRIVPIGLDDAGAPMPGIEHAATWPRAHLGKDFAHQTLARAGLLLQPGGRALCAVRKQKGAEGIADLMGTLFGRVRTLAKDRGYRLLEAERTDAFDADRARDLLRLRYRIEDPVLGDTVLETAPGVFSRKALDAGTRCLIEHVGAVDVDPRRVLDLCAGVGPLAIWALRRWASALGLAVESNLLGAALARDNAAAAGLGDRLRVLCRDGLPPDPASDDLEGWLQATDLALVNPPTHADAETLRRLFEPLPRWMAPDGAAFVVAARPGGVATALADSGARLGVHAYAHYTVLEARWARNASP
jgi:16S rRNA G1207 methylase RsmC